MKKELSSVPHAQRAVCRADFSPIRCDINHHRETDKYKKAMTEYLHWCQWCVTSHRLCEGKGKINIDFCYYFVKIILKASCSCKPSLNPLVLCISRLASMHWRWWNRCSGSAVQEGDVADQNFYVRNLSDRLTAIREWIIGPSSPLYTARQTTPDKAVIPSDSTTSRAAQ